jgi:hypothetical protein
MVVVSSAPVVIIVSLDPFEFLVSLENVRRAAASGCLFEDLPNVAAVLIE